MKCKVWSDRARMHAVYSAEGKVLALQVGCRLLRHRMEYRDML